jgi:hypothetical protein
MIKTILHNGAVALALAVGVTMTVQNVRATTDIRDLTGGGSATINGATFRTTLWQPSGTGVMSPFVRLDQHGNHTYEAGYNTSLGTPLDVLGNGNAWHTDLVLTEMLPQTIEGKDYYVFRLDLNQSSGGNSSQLTLNQVQIFQSQNVAPASGVGMDKHTGRATSASLLGTSVYDMNSSAAPTGNAVKLDFDLNKGGSGMGDMQLLVPVSSFDTSFKYVVFYSQFGADPIPGGTETNDGFEEWASYNIVPVPEPTTVIAGTLLLIPFGLSTVRALRRTRKV